MVVAALMVMMGESVVEVGMAAMSQEAGKEKQLVRGMALLIPYEGLHCYGFVA